MGYVPGNPQLLFGRLPKADKDLSAIQPKGFGNPGIIFIITIIVLLVFFVFLEIL